MDINEFFGIGGYSRPAEGYMSWQHLLFVSVLCAVMITMAIIIGIKAKRLSQKEKNRVLIISAILIDSIEIFKIVIFSVRGNDPLSFLYNLPLFLCSIQLVSIPLAAFSRGRIKEASLDFIAIFGVMGAFLGTYLAGNNYAVYPVISIDNVASGLTHCISGFVSLYIMIAGMVTLKKRSIPVLLEFSFPFALQHTLQTYLQTAIICSSPAATALPTILPSTLWAEIPFFTRFSLFSFLLFIFLLSILYITRSRKTQMNKKLPYTDQCTGIFYLLLKYSAIFLTPSTVDASLIACTLSVL